MVLSEVEKQLRKQKRKIDKYNKEHKIINGINHKICNVCKEWFPSTIAYFYPNKSNSIDGLCPNCIICDRLKADQNRLDNIERHRKQNLERYRRMKDEWNDHCKEYRKQDHDKWKSYYKTYLKSDKGKEKCREYRLKREKKHHTINKNEWENCKKYFEYKCAYCNLPKEEHLATRNKNVINMDLHKEHVIEDGKNDLSNCIPSCKNCNISKHKRTLNEWYNPSNPNFTEERYHKICRWLRYDYKLYIEKKKPKGKYTKKSERWNN